MALPADGLHEQVWKCNIIVAGCPGANGVGRDDQEERFAAATAITCGDIIREPGAIFSSSAFLLSCGQRPQ